MDPLTRLIAERVIIARTEADISQDTLAEKLGFKDRQTVSTIELGLRRVSPEELVLIAKVLGQSLAYFTDPYVVAEKKAFSYRTKNPTQDALGEFEVHAERIISAQRRFRQLLGETPSPVQPQMPGLTKGVPLDFASFQGEQSAAAWNLGDVPTERLHRAAGEQLKVSVLFVDAPDCVSGAACRLPDGGVILINRNEPLCRQNFDLGHEIFHLLTWEKMPPERTEAANDPGQSRSKVEKLADAYTAGLLMPRIIIDRRWANRGTKTTEHWIRDNADELKVSVDALYWRLVNLELIKPSDVSLPAVRKLAIRRTEARPNLYNADFVQKLHKVLETGKVTVLKAAELLDCTIDDLKELFIAYKLQPPFDL